MARLLFIWSRLFTKIARENRADKRLGRAAPAKGTMIRSRSGSLRSVNCSEVQTIFCISQLTRPTMRSSSASTGTVLSGHCSLSDRKRKLLLP